MKRFFSLLIFITFCSLVHSQELIQNGDFSSTTGWTTSTTGSGSFYYNSNYPTQGHSNPGYAYASSPTGGTQTNLSAYIQQNLTIPSNSDSATLSFWVKATLSGTATGQEKLFVYLYDNSSSSTYSVVTISFTATMSSWQQYTYSIPSPLYGHSLTLGFRATSSTTAATIRIDDVSLIYATSGTCLYSLSPTSASVPSSASSGSFSVTTDSGCSWTATSNASWLTTSSNGTGNGTVNYSYTANTSTSSQTGTITVANKIFTVTQAGATASSGSTILGIDVSALQNPIDWVQVKSNGKYFAFVKATKGTCYTDSKFISNMSDAKSAGLIIGAYHFALPEDNSATDEANYFLSVAGSYIKSGNLPPVLDLEDPAGTCISNSKSLSAFFSSTDLTTWVQTWMSTVKNATGITPILYTSSSYANYLKSSLNGYGLWIANPNTSYLAAPANIGNWNTWAFKQYDWYGSVPGISGNVDLDVFNGDINTFNALIGNSSTTPTVTITNFTTDQNSVCPGGSFNIIDTVNASAATSNVILGTSIAPTGTTNYISDISHDVLIPSLPSGTSTQTRSFTVPAGTTAGTYDVVSVLWKDNNGNGIIDSGDTSLYSVTKTGALIISGSMPLQPSAINGSNNTCLGNQNYSVTNISGVNYTWTISGGGNITGSANTAMVNWTSAGTYTITVTPSNSCGNGTPQTLSVTVNPNISAGTVSGTSPLCVGATATYSSDGSTGGTWSSTNTSVATVNSSTGLVTAVSAGTANITYAVNSGCGSPVSSMKTVTVNSTATAGTVSGTSPLCVGATVTYSSDGSTGGTWSSTNTSVATVNSSTGLVTAVSAGTTDITYTVITCSGSAISASKTLTVNSINTPIITWNGSQLSVVSGMTSYQWYNGTTIIPNATKDTLTPPTAGNYTVKITNAAGCSATSTGYNLVVTAVNTPAINGNEIEVFPNPAKNNVNIRFGKMLTGKMQIRLLDISGRALQTITTQQQNSTIPLQNIARGIYFIEITNGNDMQTVKLIIEK